MRAQRRRTKKLKVAFQFQFSNQAAWKCDSCRMSGLDRSRRCGWLADSARGPMKVVWARHNASTTVCPKSYVSAESMGWIEEFAVHRMLGAALNNLSRLPARTVDAFCVLEQEMAKERSHARTD